MISGFDAHALEREPEHAMELAELIHALSCPTAYLFPAGQVEVHQTHISAVFLAGAYAYKIKKPVDLGFLDFSTLAKRRHFCDQEVLLNRRLAPSVYLGVVPVTRSGEGVQVEGDGEVIEWAVKMRRLPESATLEKRLQRGELARESVAHLARRIAAFHAEAQKGETISRFGRFDVIARNMRENFDQSIAQVGRTISSAVVDRLRSLTEQWLERLRPIIEKRAAHGVPRDTHGDLHLDHVYLLPDRPPPDDLIIVDCIEFNERFRFADPVSDMAFLSMDLLFHDRPDLAQTFAEVYFETTKDAEGQTLLPLYTAYRAAVRAKVEGVKLGEVEIPDAERRRATEKARALWLLSLDRLERANRRPCLILIGGLPGTGKSTLARRLAEHASFRVIRSDVVRKELTAGIGASPATPAFEQGIYSPTWTERSYAECLRRAERLLFQGERVIVDASFREDSRRRLFLELARRMCVRRLFLCCETEAALVRQRLENRRNDASDADSLIYGRMSDRWQSLGALAQTCHRTIGTNVSEQQAVSQALHVLREMGLWD